jgi:hypothetical protein
MPLFDYSANNLIKNINNLSRNIKLAQSFSISSSENGNRQKLQSFLTAAEASDGSAEAAQAKTVLHAETEDTAKLENLVTTAVDRILLEHKLAANVLEVKIATEAKTMLLK